MRKRHAVRTRSDCRADHFDFVWQGGITGCSKRHAWGRKQTLLFTEVWGSVERRDQRRQEQEEEDDEEEEIIP